MGSCFCIALIACYLIISEHLIDTVISKLETTALLYITLILAYIRYTLATVVQQRKLIKWIDNNLVKLHSLALLITSIVIRRNC